MEIMGTKANGYDDYICSSFDPVVRNDQLCYEVDLEKYKDKDNIEKQLDSGLVLILDYNEDRQIIYENELAKQKSETASIYVETISKTRLGFDRVESWHSVRINLVFGF